MNPNQYRIYEDPSGHGYIIRLNDGHIHRCGSIEHAMQFAHEYQRRYEYNIPYENHINAEEIRRRQKQADRRAKINEIFG